MRKLSWQKEFVVYHIKSGAFKKSFDLESGAKRSVTCTNRNMGIKGYTYATWDEYWKAQT